MNNRYIDKNAAPRPTGAARQDIQQICDYLYNLAGELSYRLEDAERRLQTMEGKKATTRRG